MRDLVLPTPGVQRVRQLLTALVSFGALSAQQELISSALVPELSGLVFPPPLPKNNLSLERWCFSAAWPMSVSSLTNMASTTHPDIMALFTRPSTTTGHLGSMGF